MSRGSPGGVVEVSTSTVCRITDSTWQRSRVAHILGGPEVDPPLRTCSTTIYLYMFALGGSISHLEFIGCSLSLYQWAIQERNS